MQHADLPSRRPKAFSSPERPTPSVGGWSIVALAMSFLMTGCGGGGGTMSITIAVRDALTLKPVPEAAVYVRSLQLHIPPGPGESLGGTHHAETVITDEHGEAIVMTPRSGPMQVIVVARGVAPLTDVLDDPSGLAGQAPRWRGDHRPWRQDAAVSTLEIQFRVRDRTR